MKLEEFKSAGGFVPRDLVSKKITWDRKEGDLVFDVFVKRHSFGMIEQILGDGDDTRSRSAHYIAESIRFGDKGDEKMTYEQAFDLDPKVAGLFVAAINEVNGVSAAPKP